MRYCDYVHLDQSTAVSGEDEVADVTVASFAGSFSWSYLRSFFGPLVPKHAKANSKYRRMGSIMTPSSSLILVP